MNGIAQVAALIGATAYIAVAQVEMFLFGRPIARRLLHVEAHDVGDVRMWAFVVGVRNTLAGVATVLGLVLLHTGDVTTGRTVVLVAAWYMLLASLAMGVADAMGLWRPRGGSVVGTVASSVPPLVVLLAAM